MHCRLLQITDWETLARRADFKPGRMADLCPISLRQLERHFAHQFHKTPKRWIVELKCQLAKELIAQGFSTKVVAADLKFASEAHFCHEFKKLYAVPPQTFALSPALAA